MDSIKINIVLPKASELKSDLNTLLSQVEGKTKFNLELDISTFKTSIGEVSQLLGKLKTQVSTLGGFETLINTNLVKESTKAIQEQSNAIKEQQKILDNGVIKTSNTKLVSSSGEDVLIKDLEQIRDEYGNIIEVVNQYDAKTGEVTSTIVKTTNEIEKQRVANEKLVASTEKVKDSMQLKLNESLSNKNFSLIDDSVFTSLQQKINSINTETPEKEIRDLQNALKNLNNSDSQIVRLQNAISKYEAKIDGLKDKYKNLVPKNELNEAISKIGELKNVLSQVQSSEGVFTNKAISSSLNEASTSMSKLGTATKIASDEQRLYNKEVVTFRTAFSDIATKVGLFSVVYSAVNKVQSSFRDGIQSVIDMDTELANMNKVVPMSNSQLLEMRDSAVSMGEALARSSTDVASAMAEFGRQYKDVQEIQNLTQTAILGSNVMDGTDSATVAKGLTTIISSMKLEAKDAITIIDSLNEVQNNYRISADSMLSGLSEVGSVAKTAGASLQELEGFITAISVSTGDAGSEVGNALKSIMSRIYKVGSEGISSDGNPAKALDEIGVSVRDLEGNFRPINDILLDLNDKWKTLTETEKIYIGQQVGGTHRFNSMIALMNNFDMAINSTATAMDSVGSATQENEIYLKSIEGRMTSLKATMEGFWYNFISSDMIKGGVDALQSLMNVLNGLQGTFGSLGLMVGTLSSAFLIFTNNPLKQFANDIVKHKTTLGGLSDVLNQVKLKITETGTSMNIAQKSSLALRTGYDLLGNSAMITQIKVIALQTALSMGLSLAITAVVSLVSGFVSSLGDAEDRIEDVNQKSKELSETLNSFNETKVDLSSYEKISQKLEDTTLSEKERNDLNNELIAVKEQLYTLDDSAYSILNNQNLGYQEQLDLLKQINDQKLYDRAEELDKTLGNGFWNQDESKNAQDAQKTLEQNVKVYKEIIALQKQANGGTIQHQDLGVLTPEQQKQTLEQLKTQIDDSNLVVQRYNSNVELMEKANYNTDRSTIKLSDSTKMFISDINKSTEAINQNTDAKDKNSNTDLGDVETISVEEATQNYGKAVEKVDELDTLLQKINEEQQLTPDIVAELAKNYSDLGVGITDISTVQQYLNDKIQEQVALQQEAYQDMIGEDSNYYNSKIKNSQEAQNAFNDFAKQFVDVNSENYNFDLDNFETLNDAKAGFISQLSQPLSEFLANLLGGSAKTYADDLANSRNWATAKSKILAKLDDQISKIENRMVQAFTNSATSADALGEEKFAKNALAQLDKLTSAKADIDTAFNEFYASFNTSAPTFGKGSSIGGSSGSNGSSATEKEISDMEKLSNRYLEVENALKQLDNELSKNKILMENASDEDRIKYLDKELELIQKQETAYKNKNKELNKELSELKKSLTANGFNIAGDGIVSNANNRLDALTNWANSLTGDNKENAQKNVKAIAETLERYNDLLLNQIPEVSNTILDLKNTTIDTQKEIVELIKKQKDAYIDNIEKETDALKKAIEKRRKLRDNEWAEETYADELKSRQETLVDLESQLQDAMRMADGELISNIKKQIESAQQEINNFIRDNERDKADKRYDDELEKIDEDAQKKIDEITSKLTDEEILKMVQNGVRDLTSVLDNIGGANKNVVTTFSTIDSNISNMRTNLSEVLKDLQSISVIDLNLNANVSGSLSTASKQTVGDINLEYKLIVEGDMNEEVLPQVEKMIKKAKDETVKEVFEKLNTR